LARPGKRLLPSAASQNQYAEFRIGPEFRDPNGIAAQYPLGVVRRVRPAAKLYDFGRRSYCGSEFEKSESVIRAFEQVKLDNVSRVRVQISEAADEFARVVFVEQSHASTQPCGKLVNRTEIVRLQFRVIIEDLLLGRAGREPLQHVPSGDAQPADRRLAGEFTGLDRDAGTHLSRVSLARDEWLYDADGRESAGEYQTAFSVSPTAASIEVYPGGKFRRALSATVKVR
jgi:hypothetical protein